jgi:prepilin-type N-terminal cleavage/methylation domain-containing protein
MRSGNLRASPGAPSGRPQALDARAHVPNRRLTARRLARLEPLEGCVSLSPAGARNAFVRHPLRLVPGDAGLTLVELLVSMSILAVVMAATFGLLEAASRSANNETERNTAISEATTGFDRMVGDIRLAYQVNGPTSGTKSDWLDFLIRPGAKSEYRIIYNCKVADPKNASYNACVRYQTTYAPATGLTTEAGVVPGGASKQVVVSRVINRTAGDPSDYVFESLSSPQETGHGPTYGTVKINTPSRGEAPAVTGSGSYNHDLVLTDSFYIRQLDFGR